jgi:SAM-dependent methyltransferase
MGWWPAGGWKAVFDPQNGCIEAFLREEAKLLPAGANLLDAGAGERPYQTIFSKQRYQSCDMPKGFYAATHDFECSLDNIPQPDRTYDAVVLTQVLEHVREPLKVLQEIRRVLKPGGVALVSIPLNSPLHGEPLHFFHFTHYGMYELAGQSSLEVIRCEKLGGAFWLLGKQLGDVPAKLMKQHDPFRARKRHRSPYASLLWSLILLPAWLVLVPVLKWVLQPLCYWLDCLDIEKSFTSGYTLVLRRPLD